MYLPAPAERTTQAAIVPMGVLQRQTRTGIYRTITPRQWSLRELVAWIYRGMCMSIMISTYMPLVGLVKIKHV
jgi:hypothetical protein